MSDLGAAVSSGEMVTTLRILLLAAGLLAATLWNRARPRAAVFVLTLGSVVGLSYWLIQISPPFGLGVDPELTRRWAQTAVNAEMGRADLGYVWGTSGDASLAPMMASLGVPPGVAFRANEGGALLLLLVLVALPLVVLKDRTTAAFAGGLALGGLWPGQTVFDAALGSPALAVATLVCGLLLAGVSRIPAARAAVRHRRIAVGLTLIGCGAVLCASFGAGGGAGFGVVLLSMSSMALAPWLRFALRSLSPSLSHARQAEAALLLAVFFGGGLFWWDPPRSVRGFKESCDPSGAILKPLEWIRANAGREEVVLASPAYGAIVAARTGRRILFLSPPGTSEDVVAPEPARRARFNRSVLDGRPIARLAEHFGVTQLFLGPGEPAPPLSPSPNAADEPTLGLSLVYQDEEDFRVFRFTKK